MTKFIHIPLNYDFNKIDGAYLRSMQIKGLLDDAIEINPYIKTIKCYDIYVLLLFLIKPLFLIKVIKIYFLYGNSFMEFLKLSLIAARVENFIKNDLDIEVHCEVGIGLARLLSFYLILTRPQCLTLHLHNVEFLAQISTSSSDYRRQKRLFSLELQLVSRAKKVTTISKFDKSIIDTLRKDSETEYIPFEDYRIIDKQYLRQQEFGNYYLVVGSMNNPPSFASTSLLIEKIPENIKLHILGSNSDNLPDKDNIQTYGRVTDEDLNLQISRCKAIILYQHPTSGFLTRLVFLKKFQKKIFINSSYSQAMEIKDENILLYSSFNELRTMLENAHV